MSRIEEMIREMCPEGVKRMRLEDLAVSICTGLNPRTNFKLNTEGAENYYVTVKEINTNKIVFSSNTDRISDDAWEIIERRSRLEKGDVLFSGIGTIGKVAYVDIEVNNWNCSESVFLIKPKQCINGKFLTYILRSDVAKNQYEPHSSGSIMKGVRKETLKSLQIPLPPLAIQEKIVEILEKFSLLSAELEAELEGRRKQYDFYRNRLLSFEANAQFAPDGRGLTPSDSVQWKALGEVAELGTGSHNTQDGLPEGDYSFYTRGVEVLRLNSYDFDETAIITAGDGAGVGKVIHFVSGKYALHQRAYRIVPDKSVLLPRFLYQYMRVTFYDYIMKSSVSSSVTSVRKPMLISYPIPIPPLAEQERIVKILDKFEALVTDLSAGLPAEIERVQKQYEYYRNKLLTF